MPLESTIIERVETLVWHPVFAGSDQAMEDLRRILEAREPLYRKADMVLDTSGCSVEESFSSLKSALQTHFQ